MAEIELRDVSITYAPAKKGPQTRIFGFRQEPLREDMPVVTARGVRALDHVNLTIPDGQTFVVLGPSGCGKSTLLRVVAGIADNYSGQVFYDGVVMEDVPPKKRYIGMVFQSYALYPNFNNEGNLTFFFKLNKIDDAETRERIRYTSELMGIGFNELLPRRPGTLSGGQQQRVAIARAIVRAPRLFLFDEPLSNLDAKLRMQTRTEIKRLLHRFGITSIYVTHDQTEAMALADQIVIMRAGKIEQVGTYQELMLNPLNVFAAWFLGLPPMNLLAGGIVADGQLTLGEDTIRLPESVAAQTHDGQIVTLGMRPEAVAIATGSRAGSGLWLAAVVESLELDLVHHTQNVYLRSGCWTFTGICLTEIRLQIGQPVQAQLDPQALYFFDELSGKRI